MITPFDEKDRIDMPAVQRVVAHLLATGTQAIVVSGSTGENPTLEEDEKQDLLKAVVAQTRGKAKVIMGTGSNITKKTVKDTEMAQKLGADGVLVVAPYYNKPDASGQIAHFAAVASSTSLPIIVYNIPGRTGINIASQTILDLAAKYPNIHALKDSTGNVEQASDIAGAARQDFVIYSGDDNLTLPFLSIGASGVISVASHIIGSEIAKMQEAFFAGNLDEARSIHYKSMDMFKGLFLAPNPSCVKYCLSLPGLCRPDLRLPLAPLAPETKAKMDQLMTRYANKVSAHAS